MPGQFEGFGIKVLFPENWKLEDETESSVTVESPEGAFLSISRLDSSADPDEALKEAMATMAHEYEDIEDEPTIWEFPGHDLTGVVQRFVYLDMVVVSHLLALTSTQATFLLQIQGEDSDMENLDEVFRAIITSMCQNLNSSNQ